MQIKRVTLAALLLLTAGLGPAGLAQEVLYTPSATSPGQGVLATRHNFSFESFGSGPQGTSFALDQYTVETAVAYGITSDLTLMAHFPVRVRAFDGAGAPRDAVGLDDMRTMVKYRFFQQDVGNIDTVRMSLMGGIEIPSFDNDFSSDSFDPFVGWALTAIRGRHGLGAHAMLKVNTSGQSTDIGYGDTRSEALRLDGSYLYRIDPVAYTIDTTRSSYLMLELNQRYETNGDLETLLSPGLLIEARTWAAELAVRVPVVQAVDHRAELDWAVTFGLRFTY